MEKDARQAARPNRREFLAAGSALITTSALFGAAAEAALPEIRTSMAAILGDRTAEEGLIRLSLPEVAEDGNTVPLTVEVESPMTRDDHVKAVHIFAESNPLPTVAKILFTPRSGKALISTRMRLAKSQKVHVLAEMSDDSVFTATRSVKVTIGGCGG